MLKLIAFVMFVMYVNRLLILNVELNLSLSVNVVVLHDVCEILKVCMMFSNESVCQDSCRRKLYFKKCLYKEIEPSFALNL